MGFEWIWNGCDHGDKCKEVYFVNHSSLQTNLTWRMSNLGWMGKVVLYMLYMGVYLCG